MHARFPGRKQEKEMVETRDGSKCKIWEFLGLEIKEFHSKKGVYESQF